MPSSQASDPGARLQLRQLVLWSGFLALLILGVVLWFRFSGRVVPMLDALGDR
jgi:hypothetical protein